MIDRSNFYVESNSFIEENITFLLELWFKSLKLT